MTYAAGPAGGMAADVAAAIAVLRETPDQAERATAIKVLTTVHLRLTEMAAVDWLEDRSTR